MNTCKTCKHFRPSAPDYKTGECALIFLIRSSADPVPDEALDKMLHFEGGHYDQFEVGENFGCIHHEPK
jgi:hypothetical protein